MAGGLNNIDGIVAAPVETGQISAPEVAPQPVATSDFGKVLYSWNAPSFIYKDKTFNWFLAVGAAILGLMGWLIYTKDWFPLVIVAVVCSVMVWYVAKVRPKNETYSITQLGLIAGDRFYPYAEIHSFWVVYDQNVKILYVAFLKKYLPALTVHLEEADPVQIKSILIQRIPEQEKRGETLIDKLVRMSGF
jgi:hypothetical protein